MANQKIIKQKEKEVNELADKLKEAKMVLLTETKSRFKTYSCRI